MSLRKTLLAILVGTAVLLDNENVVANNNVESELERRVNVYYDNAGKFRGAIAGIERVNSYEEYFERFAKKYSIEYDVDIPIELVKAIAFVETRGRHFSLGRIVESGSGALGIMQLMPTTARKMKVNPYKINGNIKGGVKYLAYLLSKTKGNVLDAILLYNCHIQNVKEAKRKSGSDDYFVYRNFVKKNARGYVSHVLAVLPFFNAKYNRESGRVERLYKGYVAE